MIRDAVDKDEDKDELGLGRDTVPIHLYFGFHDYSRCSQAFSGVSHKNAIDVT